jgi:hypothetical protein
MNDAKFVSAGLCGYPNVGSKRKAGYYKKSYPHETWEALKTYPMTVNTKFDLNQSICSRVMRRQSMKIYFLIGIVAGRVQLGPLGTTAYCASPG